MTEIKGGAFAYLSRNGELTFQINSENLKVALDAFLGVKRINIKMSQKTAENLGVTAGLNKDFFGATECTITISDKT